MSASLIVAVSSSFVCNLIFQNFGLMLRLRRVILWCDGLKSSSDGVSRKRKCTSDLDVEDIDNNSDNGSSKQPATKKRKKTVQRRTCPGNN